jgi:solute carrier family 25 carnitine/acylcarnitine transporter 20/29
MSEVTMPAATATGEIGEEAGASASELGPTQEFVAGAAGGVCECLSGHPLDTVKVRLVQAQGELGGGAPRGVWCTFAGIARAEGLGGLYRGVSSPLAGLVLINATMFASFETASKQLADRGVAPLQTAFLAGCVSGMATTTVESPVDLIKVQLQRERPGQKRRYKGYFDCCARVLRTNGPLGVYQGASATLCRNVPGQGFHFLAYEASLLALGGHEDNLPATKVLAAGAMAGLALWLSTYPFDVIKTILQSQPLAPAERLYSGVGDCATQLVRRHGARGLWVGVDACVLRSVPSTAACFLGYETAASAFRDRMADAAAADAREPLGPAVGYSS